MKSFGFKQLRRKEGPSFYLKGFQRNKCHQWAGKTKIRGENNSAIAKIKKSKSTYSEGAT